MDLEEARTLAEGLMARHRLAGWRFTFDTAKRRAGVCRYATKTLALSAPLTRLHSEAEVRDTILHEIAHALVGAAEGHSARWRATAVRIGGTGERCVSPDAPRVAGDWVGVCAVGHTVDRHRRPTRPSSCRRCARGFEPAHLLEWTHRGRAVAMHPAYVEELAAIRARGPVQRLASGARVRILVPGKYAGVSGTVVSVGRTRYRLRTAGGIVSVSFAGVEGVDA